MTSGTTTEVSWWRGTIGYEAYARSFADGNGDGIGDLAGISDRLDHIRWLGCDALWITPFYPSPGHDHGYDVADYVDVDPRHGTLDDFDHLVERAHSIGLRLIVDIVPNHSSNEHDWFRDAIGDRGASHRDFYHWRDPAPDGGPPNNWLSHFGGPAWTLDPATEQYYCHLFLPEQPDLNWANPAVADAFDDILRFWCDRGVDGFRIDVAHGIAKDPAYRDNPQLRPVTDDMGPMERFHAFEHRHDLDQEETVDVYRRWNRVVTPYDAMLIGEVGTRDPDRVARYTDGGAALHTAFYLSPGYLSWEPAEIRSELLDMHRACPDRISWELSNHDQARVASRFGGGDVGARRALAITTLTLGLGGMPFLYQGEELGLPNAMVSASGLEDPISTRNPGVHTEGRDVARAAMPWDDGPHNGFSTAEPWLPAEPEPLERTVEGQRADESSWLHRYRDLLATRRRLPDLWSKPAIELETDDDQLIALRRGDVALLCNLSVDVRSFPLDGDGWRIEYRTDDDATISDGTLTIPPEASVIATR